MIAITVDTRRAVVAERELLTTGSAGIPVQFTFSSDWDGLSIFAIFRNAEDMDSRVTVVVPESGAVSLPSECCATEYMGEPVYAGVYGTDGYGNTVIPTVWVSIGELREGASYEGAPGTANPTPDMWAQMEALALSTGAANVELAEAAQEAAETAQAGAEAAQTAAESAQSAAETAQGLAETAQSGAEIAQSAAEIAQAGAETAQTAAETAQGKAEDAQEGAEAAQAAAEAAQEAAEEAASSVNIDTEMSTTSEHAVQNKVITAALGGKVDKVSGKQLSTEDYTSDEKTKLAGIAAGAEVNVQADWAQTSTTADDYIKNKPANLVQDASYVHTDNNYTTADKTKLAGIPADADKTVIDDTLTQTGEAADAKATGDAIGTINSALSSLASVTEIIDTASGAIASFPDGAGLPMRSLVAEINPVQDLHGEANPYPAGGGANIYDSEYELGYYDIGDGSKGESISWARSKNPIPSQASTTYRFIFSGQASSGSLGYVLYYDSSDNYLSSYTLLNSSTYDTGQTMTTPENCAYMKFYNHVNWFTQVQVCIELSTVTGFHPYSNICPISGWTGLSGQRTANAQQWDEQYLSGYYNSSGVYVSASGQLCTKNKIPVAPNKEYYFGTSSALTVTSSAICFYDASEQFITRVFQGKGTFVTPANACFINVNFGAIYGGTYNNDLCINYPSTDTSYHAYTGEAISVSFGRTVYGGSDEVVSGNGTSTMGMVDFSDLSWSLASATYGRWYAVIDGIKPPADGATPLNAIAEEYKIVTSNAYNNVVGTMYGVPNGTTINVCNGSATDKPKGKLVYELATPQTFTHAGQSVDTLVGQNNVFVDTGDVTVTYQASIKGYIDKVLAS